MNEAEALSLLELLRTAEGFHLAVGILEAKGENVREWLHSAKQTTGFPGSHPFWDEYYKRTYGRQQQYGSPYAK